MRDFRVVKTVGSGSYGKVYQAEEIKTRREVAIKTSERVNLSHEHHFLSSLKGLVQFPEVYTETQPTMDFFPMELLGKNLRTLFKECGSRFSLKTVLMFAEQALSCLQSMHMRGIVHRDLKPANFVLGLGPKSNVIHLVDFGLACNYVEAFIEKRWFPFAGTVRYCSIGSMQGNVPGPRDDLENLGYLLIYFLKGGLPWQHKDKDSCKSIVLMEKMATSPEELCKDLPSEFQEFITSVRALRVDEVPDYRAYKDLFRKLFMANNFVMDYRFDWLCVDQISFNFDRVGVIVKPKTDRVRPSFSSDLALSMGELARRREMPLVPKPVQHLRFFARKA